MKKIWFKINKKLTPPHMPVIPCVLRVPLSHGSKCFTCNKNMKNLILKAQLLEFYIVTSSSEKKRLTNAKLEKEK